MPEDSTPSSAEPDDSQAKPKVRRISNKPPRKGTEEAPAKEPKTAEIAQPETRADSSSDAPAAGKADPKRNNRRRRGKGKGSAQAEGQPKELESPEPMDQSAPASSESDAGSETKRPEPSVKPQPQPQQRAPQPPRRKLDPEKVAKNAWKIYLAEVSEEGVALIADNDARELARRCFRLSEIFLEEEDRRN